MSTIATGGGGVAKPQVFGLDLGTTNCCVAIFENGTARTLEHGYNQRIFPSTVTIQGDVWHIGQHQITDIRDDDSAFIHGTKRIIGRDTTDGRLKSDIRSLKLPFELDEDGKPFCRYGEHIIFPEEVIALLFLKAQAVVRESIGTNVDDCVVGVPAYFTEPQRQGILDGARIAGLNVVRLINEPTAIAVAYLHDVNAGEDGIYDIADLGGGTFDHSRVSLTSSKEGKTLVVEATRGDNMLGGYDFTQVMVNEFKELIEQEVEMDELWGACETAKTKIKSGDTSVKIRVASKLYSLDMTAYKAACEPLREKIRSILKEIVNEESDSTTLKSLILAGGSSLLPFLEEEIAAMFSGVKLSHRLPSAEVVAQGCAIASSNSIVVTDVLSRSIGIEIQEKKRSDLMSFLLGQNTPLPASYTETFTARDPENTEIRLYEGQDQTASSNILLGQFHVPARRGDNIEVRIEVHSDSTVALSATSSDGTGALQVTRKTRFTEGDFQNMAARTRERFFSTRATGGSQKRRQLAVEEEDHGSKRNKLAAALE